MIKLDDINLLKKDCIFRSTNHKLNKNFEVSKNFTDKKKN